MSGHGDRLVSEHNGRMMAAFITAKLTREKKMTPLRDLLIDDRKRNRRKKKQTVEDHKNAFDAWVIATGGTLGGEEVGTGDGVPAIEP